MSRTARIPYWRDSLAELRSGTDSGRSARRHRPCPTHPASVRISAPPVIRGFAKPVAKRDQFFHLQGLTQKCFERGGRPCRAEVPTRLAQKNFPPRLCRFLGSTYILPRTG